MTVDAKLDGRFSIDVLVVYVVLELLFLPPPVIAVARVAEKVFPIVGPVLRQLGDCIYCFSDTRGIAENLHKLT